MWFYSRKLDSIKTIRQVKKNRPTAYDAHYLALAEYAGCAFWTADQRLFDAVRRQLDWVHWLGENNGRLAP